MDEPGNLGGKESQAGNDWPYAILHPVEKGFGSIYLAPEESIEKVLDGLAEFWLRPGTGERHARASIYGIIKSATKIETRLIGEVVQGSPLMEARMAKIEAEKLEKAAEAAAAPSRRIGPRL